MVEQQEQNDILGDFARRLEKIRFEYMLVGSMALAHYAVPRATVDIDVVVEIPPESIDEFIKEFESDFYIPVKRAQQAARQKGTFNILHNQTLLKIDCVVLKNSEFKSMLFHAAERSIMRANSNFGLSARKI